MDSRKTINVRIAVICWFATAGYMAFIFFLSSRHFPVPHFFPTDFDKLAHILIYMPLAFFFFISLRKIGLNKYVFLISFVLAGIYGITDELHQYFVPGPEAAAGDVVADFFGAFLGSLVASLGKY